MVLHNMTQRIQVVSFDEILSSGGNVIIFGVDFKHFGLQTFNTGHDWNEGSHQLVTKIVFYGVIVDSVLDLFKTFDQLSDIRDT